ncbi:hypothetical protein [Beggiatoa leptomitoformis]|uniref:Uncharacterized protein n=1 Tax=Beggiatoa leptomitoformis TaxID=288004 RepID=A0A2N9YC13_9GAMM|nr:hypothetical protein [Beggiatoa leptomitoformis]ALG66702.1 hypothetical protein AL038_01895 [Beggiatoa leptomitoformis]AUI67969.1 hypothetical protein BLE401_04140 [Beggiatoa leptomitoformis]
MIRYLPFYFILFIICNALFFTGVDLSQPLLTAKLMSGAEWKPTLSDSLIMLGVIFLYFEIFKSTRSTDASIIEHMFSMLVFVAFLIEFIVYKQAGNSTFLILTMMSMFDVIAGFTISISTARHDFTH